MDIESLEYFLMIAEGFTFMDTAFKYNISTSSLSKAIRRLEDELDVDLFDRRGRNVKLTPAGKALLAHIKRMMPYIDNMRSDLHSYAKSKKLICWLLPYSILNIRVLLNDFSDNHPNIGVEVNDSIKYDEISSNTNLGKVDIIITHQTFIDTNLYDTYLLKDDLLLAIVSENHPLYQQKTIYFDDLIRYPLWIRPWCANSLENHFREINFNPNLIKCDEIRSIILMNLAPQKGVALFYKSDIQMFHLDELNLSFSEIVDAPYNPLIIAVRKRKSRSAYIDELIHYLAEHVK